MSKSPPHIFEMLSVSVCVVLSEEVSVVLSELLPVVVFVGDEQDSTRNNRNRKDNKKSNKKVCSRFLKKGKKDDGTICLPFLEN